jgi:protein phosphatase
MGLAGLCESLLEKAKTPVATVLAPLISKMHTSKIAVSDLALALNQCLLEQAALLPLTVQIAGGTDPGSNRHNEDSFYPSSIDLSQSLAQHLGIVCDGVAGHEGGELASQMAVQSLRLQMQSFLDDVTQETTLLSPVQVTDHLKSVMRVVNNLIASQNDEQNRESRRRMATTMVMALQLPQQIQTAQGLQNGHEIYIAHVGDSRAYWLTENSCQLLTVDDDVAQREVIQGKSVPWQAQGRIDAGSLTQALGIRTGAELNPMVQRLVVIEDGVLLLCSDGLSDRQLIERSWPKYIPSIIHGELSLTQAIRDWMHQASIENGHDNISLVLMSCHVTPEVLQESEEQELEPEEPRSHWVLNLFKRLILLELLLGGLAIGLIVTYILHPQWFKRLQPTPPTALPSPTALPTLPAVEDRNGI